jgi:regulator of RNase E activity RraA
MIQGALPLHRVSESMAGEAVTVRCIPAREELNTPNVFRNPAPPRRQAIEHRPAGKVPVFDSRKDARATSAGAILGDAGEA